MSTKVLEDHIADSMEEVMQPYTASDEYRITKENIAQQMTDFRVGLSQSQQVKFNLLMDMVNNADAEFATKAYVFGTVNGISLRGEVLGDKKQIIV